MSMARSTEVSGFLDGKEYTASFLYEFCALLVGNGVYADELAPTATNDNMTITHGSGHAWINGVLYRNTTPFSLDIDIADGSLNRYDSLMLRLDLSQNETYAVVVKGDFATSPTPPAVTRNAETFDLKICDIYIPAGCTKITQDKIIDTRLDTSVCGVPVFLVDHLDMSTFYRQINADLVDFRQKEQAGFTEWTDERKAEIVDLLDQLKGLVGSDAVGELVNKINEKLPKAGGDMSGAINMNGNPITGLRSPQESSEPATKEFVENIAPTFSQADKLENLTVGEKLVVSLGKIMKAIADLISHLSSKSNPHGVAADQLTSGTLSSDRLPTIPVKKGGTGAITAADALTNLGAQSKITVKSTTGNSLTVAKGSFKPVASLSLEAGTWLIFGGCRFGAEASASATVQFKVCLSTSSTTFDSANEGCITNIEGAAVSANCQNVFSLTAATTVYLLAYNGLTNSNDVTNGRIYAIKIG